MASLIDVSVGHYMDFRYDLVINDECCPSENNHEKELPIEKRIT